MKKHIIAVIFTAILVGNFNNGCAESNQGISTIPTMQPTKFDGAQGDCTNGGVKIEVLIDGVVDDTQTQYICNGAQGQGGTSTNIKTTKFDGAHGDCTDGGVKIEVLVNGMVDDTQTQYICNGVQGQDGQDGQNGQDGQDGLDGQDGQSGQNGTQFTLQTTKFDGAQGDCTNGGVKIEVLSDGVVDETQTQYVCNGTQGQDGQGGTSTNIKTTKFDGAQGDCTHGGVKIEVLVNGVVDDTQTQYICNGTQGENGQDGQDGQDGQSGQNGTQFTLQTTKFDGAQGDCTNGGVKIEVLVNGTVDDTQTQYICNGAQGQDGQSGTSSTIQTTKFDGAQGDCTNGGVKIEVLVNGTVDDTQTQYICNSAAQGGIFCNGVYRDTMNDSANCGSCGNVCQAGYECINGTCKPFSDLSASKTIICNGETLAPYKNRDNCNGCGIGCGDKNICLEGSCVPLGTIITFGYYEQDNDDGPEPIEWRILDQNAADQYLVISEKVLEKKKYNETDRDITWEKSTIRSWLNGYPPSYNSNGVNYTAYGFIDAAFTTEEQAKIIASNVPAHENSSYSTSPGNATTDKIFLLSIAEVKQYFSNSPSTARLADATRYAVKQGMSVRGTDTVSTSGGTTSSNGTCTNIHCYAYWWLRSPGSYSDYAAYVNYSGGVIAGGSGVTNGSYGVRPALWLDY